MQTAVTKTDRQMEDAMLAFAGDSERVEALSAARAFKRTWLELANVLTAVYDRGSWERWGFEDFEAYCRKELRIKPGTAQKLLGSYRFLANTAPRVLERTRDRPEAPVPSLQAVSFVERAAKRGAVDKKTMREIETAAFDEGASAPMLTRRFKEIAFPVDDDQRLVNLRRQLTNGAKRLAGLIAEPEAPVPHKVAVAVEEALGRLLDSLDAAN